MKRISAGKYLFGTKQILAKIINDKLVIRVGGGYMSADEFIETYGPMEMLKAQKADEQYNSNTSAGASPTKKGLQKSATTIGGKPAASMAEMKEMMKKQLQENVKIYGD